MASLMKVGTGYRKGLLYGLFFSVAVALLVRAIFFTGFCIGDDMAYFEYASAILKGTYPDLTIDIPYAFRPVWHVMIAASIALFGPTNFGLVAPVFTSGVLAVAVIYLFTARFFSQRMALFAALLLAINPFHVVNSGTLDNDIPLALFVLTAFWLFLEADRSVWERRGRFLFVFAALLMALAALIKLLVAPALVFLGLVTLSTWWHDRQFPCRHLWFHLAFLILMITACGLLAIWSEPHDPLLLFKAQLQHFQTNLPIGYPNHIPYSEVMPFYVRNLLSWSGEPGWRYFEHGLHGWLLIPALFAGAARGGVARLMAGWVVLVVTWLTFWPEQFSPYHPMVRQTRYLELISPMAAMLIALFMAGIIKKTRIPGWTLILLVTVAAFGSAGARHYHYTDSMADIRDVAEYIKAHADSSDPIYVDKPMRNSLTFYLAASPHNLLVRDPFTAHPADSAIVVFGGARNFWWGAGTEWNPPASSLPSSWRPLRVIERPRRPWRPSSVRLFEIPADLEGRKLVAAVKSVDAIDFLPPEISVSSLEIYSAKDYIDFEIIPVKSSHGQAGDPEVTSVTFLVLLDLDRDSATGIMLVPVGSDLHVRARYDETGWGWYLDRVGWHPSSHEMEGTWSENRVRMRVFRSELGEVGRTRVSAVAFVERNGCLKGSSAAEFGMHEVDLGP